MKGESSRLNWSSTRRKVTPHEKAVCLCVSVYYICISEISAKGADIGEHFQNVSFRKRSGLFKCTRSLTNSSHCDCLNVAV